MGSQFFIVYQESTAGDIAGGYTVLGQVTEGLDAFIDSYVAPGTANQSTDGPPAVPVLIKSITIR
jgi:peptidyl-prolyl cis-trans isomerase B (cyclophilin B)